MDTIIESIASLPLSAIVVYEALIVLAIIPIFLGSFFSIHMKADPKAEKLSAEDAYWFPVFGGGVLVGLYLLFRFFGKEYINYLLTAYFAIFGTFAVLSLLDKILREFLVPASLLTDPIVVDIRRGTTEYLNVHIDWLNGSLFVVSVAITGFYVYTKNWILNNILGESFAMNAIMLLDLDSFKTGIILLSGLFFYDIFFVFATDVMLTVAKGLDVPIKVLFPRDIFAEKWQFSLLGLGDIVIPGVFVALCLKFDYLRSGKAKNFAKPYFKACLIAYIIGLMVTMGVMHVFKHGQPALLYLSPACILSVLITAALRGEIKEVFAFNYHEEMKKQEEKGKSE